MSAAEVAEAPDEAASPRADKAAGGKAKADADLDLPRALVKRIVKAKLALVAAAKDDKKEFQVNKDALAAFAASAKVFIGLIASTANDICQEKKRQTLSADDVFMALQDLEFGEFVEPLREHLQAFKQAKARSKERQGGKGGAKKRQAEADAPEEGGAAAEADGDEGAQPAEGNSSDEDEDMVEGDVAEEAGAKEEEGGEGGDDDDEEMEGGQG